MEYHKYEIKQNHILMASGCPISIFEHDSNNAPRARKYRDKSLRCVMLMYSLALLHKQTDLHIKKLGGSTFVDVSSHS